MEDYIKRVNLSFDLRRERDRTAYEIVSSKQHKTSYLIGLVISSSKLYDKGIDKQELKEWLKEILRELNTCSKVKDEFKEDEIPKEIFNIFEQM